MNNKWQEQLQEFLKSENIKNEEDLQKAMKKYNEMMNMFEEIELSPMAQAYDYLDKAQAASSKQMAIKHAKKALEICPDCLDARLFLIDLENKSFFKTEKEILESIELEESRLKKEQYFTKDSIGRFYGIYETRPYIRGLYRLANLYSLAGKINKAIEICQKIIKLNENDNTGARFMLMALYAYKEDEKSLKELYKKYDYECLESLVPFFILYLKKSDYIKAKSYLDKIDKVNDNFKKFFKGNKIKESTVMKGYYSHGDSSELYMYLKNYEFLISSIGVIDEFIKRDGDV